MTRVNVGRWSLVLCGLLVAACVGVGVIIGIVITPMTASAQAVKTFEAPAGMILNYVESERTASFEEVITRLGAVIAESEDPELVRQAAGWRVYKALEPGPNNNVLYVSFIDPAVPETDYSVVQILNEQVPNEVQQLYDTFNGSFGAGQSLINLELFTDLSGLE